MHQHPVDFLTWSTHYTYPPLHHSCNINKHIDDASESKHKKIWILNTRYVTELEEAKKQSDVVPEKEDILEKIKVLTAEEKEVIWWEVIWDGDDEEEGRAGSRVGNRCSSRRTGGRELTEKVNDTSELCWIQKVPTIIISTRVWAVMDGGINRRT